MGPPKKSSATPFQENDREEAGTHHQTALERRTRVHERRITAVPTAALTDTRETHASPKATPLARCMLVPDPKAQSSAKIRQCARRGNLTAPSTHKSHCRCRAEVRRKSRGAEEHSKGSSMEPAPGPPPPIMKKSEQKGACHFVRNCHTKESRQPVHSHGSRARNIARLKQHQ